MKGIHFILTGLILMTPYIFLYSQGLVPCGNADDGSDQCNFCSLVTLGENILNFLVQLTAVVGVLGFVIAGVIMITAGGNEQQIGKAKGIFGNVFIGILIVLSAWLLVNVLTLTLTGRGITSWVSEVCQSTFVDVT